MSTNMHRPPPKPGQKVTIKDLYPNFTPQQQEEAEYYLKRYLSIVRRIYERTHNLTTSGRTGTLPNTEAE